MNVVVFGLKGGQGKSSLAVRLGLSLARAGHRTLVVDLCAAASASHLLGFGEGVELGSAGLLGGKSTPAEVIVPTGQDKLLALPADLALAGEPGPQAARLLRAIGRRHDFTLIDAPTGDGPWTTMALLSADWALLPVVPDELSLVGARASVTWLRHLKGRKKAQLAGLVVNRAGPRSAAAAAAEAALRDERGRQVFKAALRRDASFSRPAGVARALRAKAPKGVDLDVQDLRRELLRTLLRRNRPA
ncbi:MAG: ParA family protein [Acidobacteriota bacterium]